MKTLALLTLAIAASTAQAGPRTGLLAEFHFNEGSARILESAGSQLGQIAAWANENFDSLIILDGHADYRGEAAGNIRLSLRRARVVRNQLVALGVDPNQIIITAFDAEKNRPRARVAVWGTTTTLEQVLAKRKRARAVIYDDRMARPKPRAIRRR